MSLQDYCKKLIELEVKKNEISAQLKAVNAEIADVERALMDAMQAQGLKSVDTDFGKFALKTDVYATIKDQDALVLYLKEKGIYEQLATLSSASMNSFYKKRLEEAKEAGDIDFNIPGMEVTSQRFKLSITNKKTFKV